MPVSPSVPEMCEVNESGSCHGTILGYFGALAGKFGGGTKQRTEVPGKLPDGGPDLY
jgi:hypothetical protein